MILHVYDDSFVYRGRIANWISMNWTEEYQGEGAFELVVFDTDQYAGLLQKGWYFSRTDRPAAMMAVNVERDTDKHTITVGGYSALHMLSRRIINLKQSFSTVEGGVYGLINADLRGLIQISTAEPKGLPAAVEFEAEGTGMLDAVIALIGQSSYGIRANFDPDNQRHVVEVYAGVDRTYDSESGGTVFSQEFGNLLSLTVTEDDDLYKNVAYVTGHANNDSRTIYYQYVSPEAGAHENWREIIVNGENQEEDESKEDWKKKQKQIGIEALQARKNALSFEAELSLGVFGEKYDLGDAVTCKSRRYGLQFDTRIMKYKHTSKNGKETVRVILGNRPLNFLQYTEVKSSGRAKASGGGGSTSSGTTFTTDETLSLSAAGVLSVNRATEVEADNTLPITSAAVHTTVGNIEALLSTI